MKQSTAILLGAGALLGTLAITPTFAEILVESSDGDRNVYILLDRESADGEVTREYYDGAHVSIDEENTNGHILRMMIDDGDAVSTCVRLEDEDGQSPLTCLTSTDRKSDDVIFYTDEYDAEIRHEVRQAMREYEREMAAFEREMAELGRELSGHDGILAGIGDVAAELADMAAHIEDAVMTSLAESGVRIESDGRGNETVWIESDDDKDPSMRIMSGADGENLIFMYFDGFENDYHYVIENDERGGDHTTVHAFDVSTVEIHESRRNEGRLDAEATEDGEPHLTINTDHPDDVRVIRLDRSRFDG